MPDAPSIYDINIDEKRPVTQADCDSYQMLIAAYGFERQSIQRVIELARRIALGEISVSEARSRLAQD